MVNDFIPRSNSERESTSAHGRSDSRIFKTPDAIATADDSKTTEPGNGPAHDKTPKHRRSLKAWIKSWGKKQWIIFAVIVAVLLAGGGVTAYALLHHKPVVKPAAVKKATPIPKPAPAPLVSTLTGLPIGDASVNQRPVTGVMIENSTDARPQSGLDQAGVVFEAIAEGGITRFLALFQDSQPDYIGPVRSVRPYYIQWALGFDAAIAHVGGSPEGLQDMIDWHVKNLDQFVGGAYFQRISSRYAPHNVYTSIAKLNQYEAAKGYGAPTYTGFERKKDAPGVSPNAKTIDLTLSGYYFNVHYDYDYSTNTYKRSEGGKPHMEVDSAGKQTQIAPKVVIALVMPYGLESDDLHSSYATIGSGQAYVFQDGTVTIGTWKKTDKSAQFTFTNQDGATIKLNPGQTWITALGATNQVKYTP